MLFDARRSKHGCVLGRACIVTVKMNFIKKMKVSLLIAALATFAASAGQAAVVDFSFGVTTWNNGLNGFTGSDFLPIQGAGFTFGGVDVFLAGGFFHDGASGACVGTAVY
jgi:hypothetical protein